MKMLKLLDVLKMIVIVVFVSSVIVCGDGVVEDVGEMIDEVVIDMGNVIEDVCEDVKEGVDVKDKDC